METEEQMLVNSVIDKVKAERRTFMSRENLLQLASSVKGAPENGAIVEAGCALGGSAAVLAAAKETSRPMYMFDVFGLIPAPKVRDGIRAIKLHIINKLGLRKGFQGDRYYGYRENLLDEIKTFFKEVGVSFEENGIVAVKGKYEDTLKGPVDFDVALAHIDCDWYESVMRCLRAFEPRLLPGGRLIMDDYYEFKGCRDAVREYFEEENRKDSYQFLGRPQNIVMHIVKKIQ